jgi:hypothetical protein
MDTPRVYWPIWMETLRRQGLAELAAWALEVAGPLNILGAQMLYIGQPFVPSSTRQGLRALACLLEQEDEARVFVALLKGKPQ